MTDHAIGFALGTHWQDLPPEVQHQTKRCLLDTLGALLAGTQTPVGRMMAQLAADQYGGRDATILVDGRKVSITGAALANGFSCNALDIDDGYRLVRGHPGACALPPVLAAAELTPQCSGKQLLTGLLIGYEIGIRAGLIRHATYETYHSSGSWGAIAGAAAAGRIMGLNAETLRHAMGVAEYHAPIAPMMKGIETPSMGKDSIGWGAMVAMVSVLMAREGFTGIEPLFSDTPNPYWVEKLGQDWQIFHLYFKPYAACRWAQPAIEGALQIKAAHDLKASDIKAIRVRSFHAACALSTRAPANTEEAQYNIAYPVAAALVDGEVGPHQVLPPRIFNKNLLELVARITTEVKHDYEAAFPAKTYAQVVIETTWGEIFNSGRVEPRWEPPASVPTDEELEAKFRWLVGPVLGDATGDSLVNMVWSLDQQRHVGMLIQACVMDTT